MAQSGLMTFSSEKKRSAAGFWKSRDKGEEDIKPAQRLRSDEGHQGNKQQADKKIKLAAAGCQSENWKKKDPLTSLNCRALSPSIPHLILFPQPCTIPF